MSLEDAWERGKRSWPHHEWSRFVDAGGLRWHVQLAGHGPTLLLVHGTGASTHSWRGLLPALARHFRVLAVDLPGHGFTQPGSVPPAPADAASIPGMSARLGELLRRLNFGVDYCVGHSAGAVVLCRMALDALFAPRVIIALNGAFVPFAGVAGTWFAPMARLMASASIVPRLIAWSARNPANVGRMIESTGSRLDAEGLELYTRLVRDPRHVAGALDMMGNWDLHAFERDLPRLATPLALIVADNDRTVPPHQAQWVRQRVPGAQLHRLPGLGHLAHEEDAAAVATVILEICAAYPPHAGRPDAGRPDAGRPDAVSAPGGASADPSGRPSVP